MTIWHAAETPLPGLLIVTALLLLLWNGYLCLLLAHVRDRRTRILPAAVSLLALFALFFLFLDGIFHYGDPNYPRTWPAVTAAFCSLPVFIPLLAELFAALWLFWVSRKLTLLRKARPTPDSVKETVDLLPAGIAFAGEDGQTVFANLTMAAVSRALTGKVLTDLRPLLNLSEAGDLTEAGTPHAVASDGTQVWKLSQGRITQGERAYCQLTATDVTALARINDELRSKNDKLRELHQRLENYNWEAERIILSQELLNARMQVHNETGHVLLISRRYMDDPTAIDAAALLRTLTVTNAQLLKEFEEDDTQRDTLTEAIQGAGAIGITVHLRGAIPERGTPRTILAAAIQECASNLRKHGDGDRLEVQTEEIDGGFHFTLAGNGRVPDKPLSETGGLSSLRALVENAGGTMSASPRPSVTIVIHLPE
ncbi:MAG: hypothetical protein J5789_03880 [Oscillospiraceae bacterium]|nr:hypothetical protein [Oscillospiraceae bacterium]